MKHDMKRLLCLVIWSFAAVTVVANDAASLVLVHQEEEYSAASDPTGRLTEFLGAKEDVDASRTWNPGLPMPLTLAELIERARTAVPKPEGAFVYADPEFRAADLRSSDGNLWFWEVHFAFNLDRSIKGQALIKDGEMLRSVLVLPNGGLLAEKRREMTPEERIIHGVDKNPSGPSTGPVDGSDPFAPKAKR